LCGLDDRNDRNDRELKKGALPLSQTGSSLPLSLSVKPSVSVHLDKYEVRLIGAKFFWLSL